MKLISISLAAAAFVICLPVNAAEYVYSKSQGYKAIGLVDLHQVNSEVVNFAPLCAQLASKITVTRIIHEGSILQGFEGTGGGEKLYFTVDGFYEKFPNATRAQFQVFLKPGAKVLVAYQECGRSPIKHPLTILLSE